MPSGIYIRTNKRSWKVKDSSRMGVKKGTRLSEAHRIKIRDTQKRNYASGKITLPNKKGKTHSITWKNNISKSMKGKTKSEIHIKKIKEARKNQIFPKYDTSIEVKIQNFLKQLNIEFFTHQHIKEIEHSYRCDIFIPSKNLVIECDGDYWHKYPIGNDIDHIRTSELLFKGFKVLRLWENEIKPMTLNDFKKKLDLCV